MKKRTLSILLCLCMVLSVLAVPAFAAENPFQDVTEGKDWFAASVLAVYERGLMTGYGTTDTFNPDGTTSRAQIVVILHRLEDTPKPEIENPFTDLTQDWYKDAVVWASENKIVNGYGGGLFGPDDNVTREQLAKILYGYAQYKGYDVSAQADLSGFPDADKVDSWAATELAWANAAGLINGTGEGFLNPTGNAPRSQLAAILDRFCTNIVDPAQAGIDLTPPEDAVGVTNVEEFRQAVENGETAIKSDVENFPVTAGDGVMGIPEGVTFWADTVTVEAPAGIHNDGTLRVGKLVMTSMEKPEPFQENEGYNSWLNNLGDAAFGSVELQDTDWTVTRSDEFNAWLDAFGPSVNNGFQPGSDDGQGNDMSQRNANAKLTIQGDLTLGKGSNLNVNQDTVLTVTGETTIAPLASFNNRCGTVTLGDLTLKTGEEIKDLPERASIGARFTNYGAAALNNVTLEAAAWGVQRTDEFGEFTDYPDAPEFRSGAWEGEGFGPDQLAPEGPYTTELKGSLTVGTGGNVNNLKNSTLTVAGDVTVNGGGLHNQLGTLTVAGSTAIQAGFVNNDGTFALKALTLAQETNLNNNESGVLTVAGEAALDTAHIHNNGKVTFQDAVSMAGRGEIANHPGGELTFDGALTLADGTLVGIEAYDWGVGFNAKTSAVRNDDGAVIHLNGETTLGEYTILDNEGELTVSGSITSQKASLITRGYVAIRDGQVTATEYADWNDEWEDLHTQDGVTYQWIGEWWSCADINNAGTMTVSGTLDVFQLNNNAYFFQDEDGNTVERTGNLTIQDGAKVTVTGWLDNNGGDMGPDAAENKWTAGVITVEQGATVTLAKSESETMTPSISNNGTFTLDGTLTAETPASLWNNRSGREGEHPGVFTVNGSLTLDKWEDASDEPAVSLIGNEGEMTVNGALTYMGPNFSNDGKLTIGKDGSLTLRTAAGDDALTVLRNFSALELQGTLRIQEKARVNTWSDIALDGGSIENDGSIMYILHEQNGQLTGPAPEGLSGDVFYYAVVESLDGLKAVAAGDGFIAAELEEDVALTISEDLELGAELGIPHAKLTVASGVTVTVQDWLWTEEAELLLEDGAKIVIVGADPEDMGFDTDNDGAYDISELQEADGVYTITVTGK